MFSSKHPGICLIMFSHPFIILRLLHVSPDRLSSDCVRFVCIMFSSDAQMFESVRLGAHCAKVVAFHVYVGVELWLLQYGHATFNLLYKL